MKLIGLKLFISALMILVTSSAFASLSYQVSIDTSSIIGTEGSLYFQFNPGSNSPDASADILNFTGGNPIDSPFTNGNVSGILPSNVTFHNTEQLNDYFHQYQYGSYITFNLLVSGSPGSTFGFFMYSDRDGTLPVLTTDPNGTVFTVSMNENGVSILSPNATVSSVPLPATFLLFGSGLLSFIGFIRRRKVA